MKKIPIRRRPPRCVYCGQTRPRVIVVGGKAHRRCVDQYAGRRRRFVATEVA